jgi:hypothetical protein
MNIQTAPLKDGADRPDYDSTGNIISTWVLFPDGAMVEYKQVLSARGRSNLRAKGCSIHRTEAGMMSAYYRFLESLPPIEAK